MVWEIKLILNLNIFFTQIVTVLNELIFDLQSL